MNEDIPVLVTDTLRVMRRWRGGLLNLQGLQVAIGSNVAAMDDEVPGDIRSYLDKMEAAIESIAFTVDMEHQKSHVDLLIDEAVNLIESHYCSS